MVQKLVQCVAVFIFVVVQLILIPIRIIPLLLEPWRSFIIPHLRIKMMQDTAMFCECIGLCKFYKFIRLLYRVAQATAAELGDGKGDTQSHVEQNWMDFGGNVHGLLYTPQKDATAAHTNGVNGGHKINGSIMNGGATQSSQHLDSQDTNLNQNVNSDETDEFIDMSATRKSSDNPVYIILHGGGFIYGCPTLISGFSQGLSNEMGHDVIALKYPLAPEHIYPAQVDYVIRALREIMGGAEGKVKYTSVHVVGVSAGANLALASCLKMKDCGDDNLPASLTLIGGPYSMDDTSQSYIEHEYGPKLTKSMLEQYWSLYMRGDMSSQRVIKEGDSQEDVEELTYVAPLEVSSFQGLPKTLINVAEYDILRSDSVALYRMMKNDRCDVSIHIFPGAHIHLAGATSRTEVEIIRQIKTS